ncbi:MAG: hypothetical protein JWO05_1768 [Gemmatimonadetes bacterium]|nr:hypothetical protein [Gemmatimonadota bacterium]
MAVPHTSNRTPLKKRIKDISTLRQAFDEVRFGADRTINLRTHLPTRDEAVRRLESWLRQKQVEQAGEVLVVTGRGNNSEGGVAVIREAAIALLHVLRRKGVVAGHEEHSPGSFIVTLASVRAVLEVGKRRRDAAPPKPADPVSLQELHAETRALLRDLAHRSLEALGVHDNEAFVEGEMLAHFGRLAATIPPGGDREQALRTAIRGALSGYE